MKMMELSEGLKISQPTVSQSSNLGEKIADDKSLNFIAM